MPITLDKFMNTSVTVITRIVIFTLLMLIIAKASAKGDSGFELNAAQKLIYESDHLALLDLDDVLNYAALFYDNGGTLIEEDSVDMRVTGVGENHYRSIKARFLSGDKKLPFANFPLGRGNPLIMTVLTRDVINMREATGGGDAYFRNRLRYAFAEDPEVHEIMVEFNGEEYTASTFTLTPYIDDKLIERFPEYENKEYQFTVGEHIPGGIYSIRIHNPHGKTEEFVLKGWRIAQGVKQIQE